MCNIQPKIFLLKADKVPQIDWYRLGLWHSRPDYSEGSYYSMSCVPTPSERRLYEAMHKRSFISVQESLRILHEEMRLLDTRAMSRNALQDHIRVSRIMSSPSLHVPPSLSMCFPSSLLPSIPFSLFHTPTQSFSISRPHSSFHSVSLFLLHYFPSSLSSLYSFLLLFFLSLSSALSLSLPPSLPPDNIFLLFDFSFSSPLLFFFPFLSLLFCPSILPSPLFCSLSPSLPPSLPPSPPSLPLPPSLTPSLSLLSLSLFYSLS